MYLTELPLLALLIVAICYNGAAEGFLKLYPLIIAIILGMVFILIYLFRLVAISTEEVRSVGPFSSRDRAVINEGKTLILTLLSGGRMRVELYGNDGTPPMLDWAQNEEHELLDIYLYRDKAIGGKRTAARVLRYFEVPSDEAREIVESEKLFREYDAFNISVEKLDDATEISIKFTKTI